MRIKITVPKYPIWKKLVHTRPFLLEMEICQMQRLIALKKKTNLSSVLFPRLLSMKFSGWGVNILNLENFFGPRNLNRGVIVGEGISILPEAAGGSHYHYLHNLFLLRMLPNIIYKICWKCISSWTTSRFFGINRKKKIKNLTTKLQILLNISCNPCWSAVYNLLKSKGLYFHPPHMQV